MKEYKIIYDSHIRNFDSFNNCMLLNETVEEILNYTKFMAVYGRNRRRMPIRGR